MRAVRTKNATVELACVAGPQFYGGPATQATVELVKSIASVATNTMMVTFNFALVRFTGTIQPYNHNQCRVTKVINNFLSYTTEL